tara:strand:+ start:5006 stop:5812 length:807 start_codon:yes stop_codon:yes gene_type:complete
MIKNLNELLLLDQVAIYQKDDHGIDLIVKESGQFRWFEYGGQAIQSLMQKSKPEQIVMPVCQSLLVFLLLDNDGVKNKTLKVLNLGLGGASIERALATIPNILITSVDASLSIIEVAKDYFHLPPQVQVFCQKAEQFIEQTNDVYNVVICDLFIGENSARCIFTENFYRQLSKITESNNVLMINLKADSNEQLLQVLLLIKRFFAFIVLIEFDDYKNIVILASSQEIPARHILLKRLVDLKNTNLYLQNLDLKPVIAKMHYIPAKENN